MPELDRLSEADSWDLLSGLVGLHVVWLVLSLGLRLRGRARAGSGLAEGAARLVGVVAGQAAVLLGEPFELVLGSGERVRVVLGEGASVESATIRPWEKAGHLQPGEPLAIDGELAREQVEGDGDYRSARSRWALRATQLRPASAVDEGAQLRRRATVSLAAAAIGLVAILVGTADFMLLSIAGVQTRGRLRLSAEARTVMVQSGATGTTPMHGVERVAVVTIGTGDDAWEIEESLSQQAHAALAGAREVDVVVLEAGPLRVGQIGRAASLSPLTLPLTVLDAVVAALFLGFAWLAARRLGGASNS